jgi:hypothetical protein
MCHPFNPLQIARVNDRLSQNLTEARRHTMGRKDKNRRLQARIPSSLGDALIALVERLSTQEQAKPSKA